MPPFRYGWGEVGSGKSATLPNTRKAWRWESKDLGINGEGLQLAEIRFQETKNFLEGTRKVRYGNVSPRVVNYHQITITARKVNHELVQLFERQSKFHTSGFKIKFYQCDYPDTGVGGADQYDAAELVPATPSAAACRLWYFPYRGLSNESGEAPAIYLSGVLQTSGYVLDFAEGTALFTGAVPAGTNVRAYFMWQPLVVIEQAKILPVNSQRYRHSRFDYELILQQI